MNDIVLNQVLIAHPVKFVNSAIQEFAKSQNISTYILDDIYDFKYLIEDLKPQLIVVHELLLKEGSEGFYDQLKGFDLAIAVIQPESSDKAYSGPELVIKEPFQPKELFNNIRSLLESNLKKN
jgi:hypothetical protein